MRVPLIILGCMVLIGGAMYYFSTLQPPPGAYDTINIQKTPDSVIKRIRIYVVNDPTEIYHFDSVWMKPDSIALKAILDGSKMNFMNKNYKSISLLLTYNDQFFYDLPIDKPDNRQSYEYTFSVSRERDTFFVNGTVDRSEGDVVSFRAPMMPLYKQFVLTYNDKMPPPPPDSTATDSTAVDSLPEETGPKPSKTITVLQN